MKTNLEPVKKILRNFLLEIESAKHMFFSMSAPCMASACSLKDREPLFGTHDPDPPSQVQWEKEEAYMWLYGDAWHFRRFMHRPKVPVISEYFQQPALPLYFNAPCNLPAKNTWRCANGQTWNS